MKSVPPDLCLFPIISVWARIIITVFNYRTKADRITGIEERERQFSNVIRCLGATCITEDWWSIQAKKIWKDAQRTCWYVEQYIHLLNIPINWYLCLIKASQDLIYCSYFYRCIYKIERCFLGASTWIVPRIILEIILCRFCTWCSSTYADF